MALPEPIFCLYHQKNNCDCIAPVTEQKTLLMRLNHQIKLNSILLKSTGDTIESARLGAEMAKCKERIDSIGN